MPVNKAFVELLNCDAQHQPLLTGHPQTGGMRSGRVHLQPGKECGVHTTGQHEEMLIFLAGRGQAVIENEKPLDVGEGRITYIPPHTVHNIINNSDKPLSYIYCVAPTNGSGEK
jgi:mannose-6-phosphate isomerase-like protein (cupin superfamily)